MRTEQEIKDCEEIIWQTYLNDFNSENVPKKNVYFACINILKWVLGEV